MKRKKISVGAVARVRFFPRRRSQPLPTRNRLFPRGGEMLPERPRPRRAPPGLSPHFDAHFAASRTGLRPRIGAFDGRALGGSSRPRARRSGALSKRRSERRPREGGAFFPQPPPRPTASRAAPRVDLARRDGEGTGELLHRHRDRPGGVRGRTCIDARETRDGARTPDRPTFISKCHPRRLASARGVDVARGKL